MRHQKQCMSAILIAALTISTMSFGAKAEAAKKGTAVFSKDKIQMKVGKTKKVTIKKKGKIKIKNVTWSVNKKGKKVIRLSGKSKKAVTIKGIKAGAATVTAKIKANTGEIIRQKLKVTVKKLTPTPTNTATPTPANTVTPGQPTVTPSQEESKATPTPGNTAAPEQSTATPSQEESKATPTPEPQIYGSDLEVAPYNKENSHYSLEIDAGDQVHDISNLLFGAFIEDINFAADGGLYAEMVQNRSFEFNKLADGDEKHAWSEVGTISATVKKEDTATYLNENNPNYMILKNTSDSEAGIQNEGFLDGLSVVKDEKYNFSIYARGLENYSGSIHVYLVNGDKKIGSAEIKSLSSDWKKYEVSLAASETAYSTSSDKAVYLQVLIDPGSVAIDMVSMFPEDTFKGRKNGMRKDLAEKLEALSPKFLRFPGGCVIEGDRLNTAYDWKDSVGAGRDGEPLSFNGTYGDVAARKMGQDIWTDEGTTTDQHPSFMTYGLGFYEYFQLAEDIGAIGVPVVNCGISCMAGRVPEVADNYDKYIQDALDLVEFCRGDESTNWGKVRISLGHKEPFDLKYIGIGNEQWGDTFFSHYVKFVEAFEKAKEENPEMYGDIELMYSAGVDDGDSDRSMYPAAYQNAKKWLEEKGTKDSTLFAGAVDHHYYNTPEWFLEHADYYDPENYSRTFENMTDTKYSGALNVFVGEYASWSNSWKSALSEAAYMTGLERNGDIVKMAAYAPLFGNLTRMHWAPDLIWFNNHTSTCSVNYYVQKLFSKNVGTTLLKSELDGAKILSHNDFKGKVGVGTWDTSAKFDNVKITDNKTGKTIAADDFSVDDFSSQWEKVSDGSWTIKDGELVQSSTSTNTSAYGTTGTVAYFGNTDWTDYTFTVDATKTGGSEGFLIPFSVGDKNNNFFWNIGGWGNTVSCLQKVFNGSKSDQIAGTAKNCALVTNRTYHLKVVVTDTNVKCYLNDTLYVDYTLEETTNAEAYQVVSEDETGDIIIKLVNVTGYPKTFAVDMKNAGRVSTQASIDLVAGNSMADDNILGKEEVVTMKTGNLEGITSQFNFTTPKYSVCAIRIQKEA